MVSNADVLEFELGELQPDPADDRKFRLPYEVSNDSTITFNLVDATGDSLLFKKLELKKSATFVEIPFPRLKNGTYHAWLTINGRTSIRTVEVASNGLLDRFRQIFY